MTGNYTTNGRIAPARVVTLLVASLAAVVIAGAIFIALRSRNPLEHPSHPLSDEQTKSQVIEAAREIVAVAGLRNPWGGYLLMSCKNRSDPPYQGAVYVTFDLPKSHDYFDQVATAVAPRGWQKGLPPNQYPRGTTLSKDGVTAIVYQDPDHAGHGIMRVYGECRDVTDHRNDTTGWTDITDQLR